MTASKLRQDAEARLRPRRNGRPGGDGDPKSAADTGRLLHELQVHQIELEMQNAELRQAQDEREASLENYTDLYDFAPVGYFTLTPAGVINQVNLTGTNLVGMARSRLVGRSFGSLVAPALRPIFHAFLDKVFAGHVKASIDLVLLDPSGQPLRDVNLEARPLPNGEECRVAMIDITKRKESEERLRRSEALFALLIAQVPVGMYLVDAQFRLHQANPIAQIVFRKIHPLLGRDFSEIVHVLWPPPVAHEVLARFRHTLKTGEPYQSPEFDQRRLDTGTQEVYEWQLRRVTLPAGDLGVVCFFNNITERKQAEAARVRLEVMTASNQKLEGEIIWRKTLEQSLKTSELQLRQLSHQVLLAQEAERKHISRELHDTVLQTLVGISVHLASLSPRLADNPTSLRRKIVETQQLLEKSMAMVHRFAVELRPTVLDDLGLVPALQAFMRDFKKRTGVRASLAAYASVNQLPIEQSSVLYRVALEALNNVAFHAQAGAVEVEIKKLPGWICLTINDDGKSFDVKSVLATTGNGRLGLLGMRERLEMVGGTFSIKSTSGHGTTVTARIPLGKTRPGLTAVVEAKP